MKESQTQPRRSLDVTRGSRSAIIDMAGEFRPQSAIANDETAMFDHLRASEYGRLDAHDHVYLDYTGGGLYAESQVARARRAAAARRCSAILTRQPHLGRDDDARRANAAPLCSIFSTPAIDYTAIFTLNAIGRAEARRRMLSLRAGRTASPAVRQPQLGERHSRVRARERRGRRLRAAVTPGPAASIAIGCSRCSTRPTDRKPNLFAFPAQSNFSGVKHPLELVAAAHESGWDVLLDAAAFVPTNRLDLRAVAPDFVTISFYKMFGYPDRRRMSAGPRTTRSRVCSVRGSRAAPSISRACRAAAHMLAPREAGFEDGTLNYISIPAVDIGLRHLERIGIDAVQPPCRLN